MDIDQYQEDQISSLWTIPMELLDHVIVFLESDQPSLIAFGLTCSFHKDLSWKRITASSKRNFPALCARAGYPDLLLWGVTMNCYWSHGALHEAVKNGHVETIKILRDKGCPWVPKEVCLIAAQSGNLELLDWALNNGCYWDPEIANSAALNGHQKILTWASEHGYPMKQEKIFENAARGGHSALLENLGKSPEDWGDLFLYFAMGGHVDVIQKYWTLAEPKIKNLNGLAMNASDKGHLGMFKFLVENFPNLRDIGRYSSCLPILEFTSESGADFMNYVVGSQQIRSFDVAQFFFAQGRPLDDRILDAAIPDAAARGLDALQWLVEKGAKLTASASYETIRTGSMDAIRWLETKNCPWSQNSFNAAALSGKIEILEWAKRRGFRWSAQTCAYAAGSGNFTALKWLFVNGCPFNENTGYHAAKIGSWEIINFAHKWGCPWDETTSEFAAANGHLSLLQKLIANGCPVSHEALEVATENGHWDVVTWLMCNSRELRVNFNAHALHRAIKCVDIRVNEVAEKWKNLMRGPVNCSLEMMTHPVHEQRAFA